MRVVHIPLEDDETQDLAAYWTTVFQMIDEERKAGGAVLLLCGMGISRSATFAIGYLMCIEKLTLHDAYKEVQKRRNIICPNIGFFKQLIELEEKVDFARFGHADSQLFKRQTVRIIEPMPGVPVADVVWNELYEEMLETMSSSEKCALKSLRSSTSERQRPEPNSAAASSPSSSSLSSASSADSVGEEISLAELKLC